MSNTNPPLATIVESTTARKTIYGIYGIVALIVAATTVGFAATTDASIPEWLTITNAVVAFLGGPVGGLAIANTPSRPA